MIERSDNQKRINLQDRDEPILRAGWVGLNIECVKNRHEKIAPFLNPHPAIRTWDFSTDRQRARLKIDICEVMDGCPEDCPFRLLVNTSDEEISRNLRQSMTKPKVLKLHI